ncbi:NhaP-type Na+/H+ or K+/H+ antiporter [Mesobacillus persicus]|uniref:NhaP-type Na+/H+ or K+/H+ antiporter n=1 Tax=Mesobacillus persicus TaxID=930146 RepID=A0A1H7WNI3_9BACI|nr:sodium:proton antiporter [Mesobacillus persicus]SEM23152.1 NhaP-type Na+/H+ or K+/H+ antiporter [Mesobacillus persicus]
MVETALFSIVTVIALGIFSQWFAWRIQWPSIVIMSIAGLLIGPVFGLINPQDILGELYSPVISLAVALVLFEGSTSLDLREVKGISKSVFRIVTLGTFLAWMGGSLAAHFIAGLRIEIAFIIGGLLVVTGPTVIIPLLRQAKLEPRTTAVLKWEGIIVDPIGPLLALFAYEIFKITANSSFHVMDLFDFLILALLATLVGYVMGLLVSYLASRGLFPEYLKSPIILSFVLLCFTIGEVIMHETGMLAVTVMGLTLGHARKHVLSIGSIGHFVEDISVILTSTVFILLTASLTRETIMEIFTWPIISFVVAMLFVVRPLSIWISTIKTELTIQERTLIGWIAPRGIVALTVSGYFAESLLKEGYSDASILTTLTFALVFITVCVHGFTVGPISKRLNLSGTESPGVLMVGASSFAIAFANQLKNLGTPVLLTDTSSDSLYLAKKLGIKTYHGEILAEHSEYEVDLTPYETILAMKGDAAYNALVCQSYIPEFGYHNTFSLPVGTDLADREELPPSIKANLLFGKEETFKDLNRKVNIGYQFEIIEIHEKKTVSKNELPGEGTPLCIRKKNGTVVFVTFTGKLTLDEGDKLVVLKESNYG